MKTFKYKTQRLTGEDIAKVWDIVAKKLKRFPFIVVLDEADLLANRLVTKIKTGSLSPFSKRISCFELLRRSISYLIPETKIFFMTLGTKSTVIDLNPPIIDNSSRYEIRSKIPFPIILSSNCNIFFDKYPIFSLNPSYIQSFTQSFDVQIFDYIWSRFVGCFSF